jgi:hypothetical protein
MVSAESCEVCGFQWDAVSAAEIPGRLKRATDSFVDVIFSADTKAALRPSPQRWSILEYGSHLRDVLISVRERILTACIEDGPTGSAIHREERIDLGFYGPDTPSEVASELECVSHLFAKTIQSLPPGYETRQFTWSPVTPKTVTVLWAGAQALHEAEHHLADVEENLALP